MSKKSREKKQRKLQRRGGTGYARSFVSTQGGSRAQRGLQERIERGGEHYIEDNFIRLMQDSHRLRREPEFRDLYFDLSKTDAVRSRVMKKYEPQLLPVLKQSKDEQQVFYDEVRIEIIDELATPGFRQDVLKRLDRLAQRLASGQEADKLEMALFLQPFLQTDEIPWGLCGLITTIYEESAEKADRRFRGAIGEFEKVLQKIEQEGDLERLFALPDNSPDVVQAIEGLRAQPGLLQELEQEANQASQEFEEQIKNGEVNLDLFAVEELQRPLQAMAEYVATNRIDPRTANQQEMANRLAEFIVRAIGAVVTPERAKKMREDLQPVSAQWLRQKDWRGALLHGEIDALASDPPADNPFLYLVFVNQLKRWRDAQMQRDTTAEPADAAASPPSESGKADAPPEPPGGLRARATRLFGRRSQP